MINAMDLRLCNVRAVEANESARPCGPDLRVSQNRDSSSLFLVLSSPSSSSSSALKPHALHPISSPPYSSSSPHSSSSPRSSTLLLPASPLHPHPPPPRLGKRGWKWARTARLGVSGPAERQRNRQGTLRVMLMGRRAECPGREEGRRGWWIRGGVNAGVGGARASVITSLWCSRTTALSNGMWSTALSPWPARARDSRGRSSSPKRRPAEPRDAFEKAGGSGESRRPPLSGFVSAGARA